MSSQASIDCLVQKKKRQNHEISKASEATTAGNTCGKGDLEVVQSPLLKKHKTIDSPTYVSSLSAPSSGSSNTPLIQNTPEDSPSSSASVDLSNSSTSPRNTDIGCPESMEDIEHTLQNNKEHSIKEDKQGDEGTFDKISCALPCLATSSSTASSGGISERSPLQCFLSSETDDEFINRIAQSERSYQPFPFYFSYHPTLKSVMRSVLLEFMSLLASPANGNLQHVTFHRACNLFDRYMSVQDCRNSSTKVNTGNLQLIGHTCLYIMSKFEEQEPPEIEFFAESSDGTFTSSDIALMELEILKTVQWKLLSPTIADWIHFITVKTARTVSSSLGTQEAETFVYTSRLLSRNTHSYLLRIADLFVLTSNSLRFYPSIIALSILCFVHPPGSIAHSCILSNFLISFQDLELCMRAIEPIVDSLPCVHPQHGKFIFDDLPDIICSYQEDIAQSIVKVSEYHNIEITQTHLQELAPSFLSPEFLGQFEAKPLRLQPSERN